MIFGFVSLYKAFIKCRKNKRNTANALRFEQNLLENLCDLETSLTTKSYRPNRSIAFLSNSPKLREIFAADFRDRVVHHLLVPHLAKVFEPKFIYDVYNNRQGKGIHGAIKRAKQFAVRYKDGYYLQLDIKSFFYNIDKNILYDKIAKEIEDKDILWLTKVIIDNDVTSNYHFKGDKRKLELLPPHKTLFKIEKNKGLPIGNLTSQFFANIYMNDFDNFVKRTLKCKCYIRYVDDSVIFGKSKDELLELKTIIEDYLFYALKLELRSDFSCKPIKDGLDFLGYIIRPNYILTRNRVVNNFKCKKAKYLTEYENRLLQLKLRDDSHCEYNEAIQRGNGLPHFVRNDGKWIATTFSKSRNDIMSLEEIKRFLSVQASFLGHISHGDSYNLKQKVGIIDEKQDTYPTRISW